MILLTVLSFNGAPTAGLSASFDELGGTIGRADSNQMVLPDPERSISRVHARIVFRNGAYVVIDSGSNPISVNGRALGTAAEQPLNPGDQLQIGGYLLAVSAAVAAAARVSADPFADLFGDIGGGFAAAPAATSPPRPAAAATSSNAGQIPDDWDPFANHAGAAAPPAPTRAGLGDLQMAPAADSLDDLFGLGPGAAAADPFGALPAAALAPNMAAHADPLQSLARPAAVGLGSVADHGSELNAASPRIREQPPAQTPVPASPAAPAGAVFSWQDPAGHVPQTVPSFVSRAEPAMAATTAPAQVTAPVAAAVSPVVAPAAPGDGALLSALLEGLGSPGLRIEALTPDLMRLIGSLLREATRGSVELLVARAALKREMRAEMTMIVARENNPLKFSPSAEVALQYLLSPPLPGFMAAQPAMRDAFDDLRAHQLAVMAGMRSALEGVLQRFNPLRLEGELTQRSAISALLPALRKARLWDLFQDLFAQLSSEAQDEFEDLFGQAFLDAYEDQLDRLAAEPSSS
ncbi:type VI secretion system-associated FHA domain protein TagH [Roseateles sp.]|uniref:type VI secretion system-associated FHA domain protein TagH n=1 Tax=Roseateles sp. TaxID=1971397 RepID=UPI00286A2C06|nr:type VI secretion system-associated FHA domain protein TagH [Roseateles sp.]